MATAVDAKMVFMAELRYINLPQESEIPDFAIQAAGDLHILEAKPPKNDKSKLVRSEGMISKQEIAMSFIKGFFADTMPAHEPQPDEWFQWEKSKSPKRSGNP